MTTESPSGTAAHAFNPTFAALYGVEEAILIAHFQYWINHNKRLGRNEHDGRTWMYSTREEIAAHFPYWNSDQVRRITDRLVEKKVLIKGNYNKIPMDKTLWYAFENEEIFTIWQICQMHLADLPNGLADLPNASGKNAKAIPHTKTHTRTEKRKYIKESFGEEGSVKLKSDEHAKLVEKFGEEGAADRIQNLEDYILSKGANYKDHYRTILVWEKKNQSNPQYQPKATKSTNLEIAEKIAAIFPFDYASSGSRIEVLSQHIEIGNGVHQPFIVRYDDPQFRKNLEHGLKKWGYWRGEVQKIVGGQ